MTLFELFDLTKRLRRAMPRNTDVLALCDEAERLAGSPPKGPKRDRAKYMRDWRAKLKGSEYGQALHQRI